MTNYSMTNNLMTNDSMTNNLMTSCSLTSDLMTYYSMTKLLNDQLWVPHSDRDGIPLNRIALPPSVAPRYSMLKKLV